MPWRYSNTRIIETEFHTPGERTATIPHGQIDSIPVEAEAARRAALVQRPGIDRLPRPERVGGFDPRESTIVFETALDDYGEVPPVLSEWVAYSPLC
jgi:hypothetical protein